MKKSGAQNSKSHSRRRDPEQVYRQKLIRGYSL